MSTSCLSLLALTLVSCFEPNIQDGQFTCAEPPHDCPQELVCQADCVCRHPESSPPADAELLCQDIEIKQQTALK